jgi:hypothetical protein
MLQMMFPSQLNPHSVLIKAQTSFEDPTAFMTQRLQTVCGSSSRENRERESDFLSTSLIFVNQQTQK